MAENGYKKWVPSGQQISAVEEKHQKEGGYNENLLKKRLTYKKSL